jgi:pyruvate/2-oxoglutarate dehydrogenase complex dihydrolipoamide acyltransferase (E2) component
MGWFLKALFAVVLIVFAIDAKSWIGRIWGVALDQPTSRWAETIEGREALFDAAVREACESVANELSREPQRLTVSKMLVKSGDTVASGQPLFEVLTPRASLRIAAPKAGQVEAVVVDAGQLVAPGAPVVRLKAGDEAVVVNGPKQGEGSETLLPIAVLTLGEDVDRRCTNALEAALAGRHWKLESRASLSAAMSQSDVRSMLEQLWDRVSPSDIFTRHGVERLAYGRVANVEFPSVSRCLVDLEVRGLDSNGQLLFTARARGSHGPEPTLADWMGAHPWRTAGIVLFVAWLLLALFTRGRTIPYVARMQEEARDAEEVGAGRRAASNIQDISARLRRHQDAATTAGKPAIARRLAEQIDALDQTRHNITSASRVQHRAVAASGMWPEDLIARVNDAVSRYPGCSDDTAAITAIDAITPTIDALRSAIRTRTNA